MYLNFLEVIHEGQRASGHLPRVQCLKTKNPLALSNYLTRSASFRLAEKFSCLSLRHIPIIDLLIIDILFHLTENSTYYMELCWLPLQERDGFAVVKHVWWICEAGDVGLTSGSVTNLLQYEMSLHSMIICKTSGYSINYNLQELNIICECPSPTPCLAHTDQHTCVIYMNKEGRFELRMYMEGEGGKEMELRLSPCCLVRLDKEDTRQHWERSRGWVGLGQDCRAWDVRTDTIWRQKNAGKSNINDHI